MKTDVKEFKEFIKFLLKNSPKNYEPHLFRCEKKSKAPKLEYGSWKNQKQKLSVKQAIWWLKNKGNVGIAGMPDDPLVNVDIDDEEKTQKSDLKPTLIARSRSRTGVHAWYFSNEDIPNIPTDNSGEVRAKGQYVVAPGSYVPCEKDVKKAGYYTIEEKNPVSWISLNELPQVFIEEKEKNEQKNKENKKIKVEKNNFNPKKTNTEHSELFNITANDVVTREGGSLKSSERWPALFHDSSTDMNMSVSDNGLIHCWRHLVALNGLQALVVLSGYMTCAEAGSPHKNSGAGPSRVIGDDGAIFHAWKYAKEEGYIPKSDPIPTRALNYIAREHSICKPKDNGMLPRWGYNKVLEIVEEKY